MITGHINQAGSPILRITVYGNKSEVTIDGILDTGFDGFVCLPIAVAVPLGLELINVTNSELADGTIVQDEPISDGFLPTRKEIYDCLLPSLTVELWGISDM